MYVATAKKQPVTVLSWQLGFFHFILVYFFISLLCLYCNTSRTIRNYKKREITTSDKDKEIRLLYVLSVLLRWLICDQLYIKV